MMVTWEVEDGYVGKSSPQHTHVPDDELEGLTEDEKQLVIEEYVQADFDSTISWAIVSTGPDW